MNPRTALTLTAVAFLAFGLGSLTTTQAQVTDDFTGCRAAAAYHWREASEAGSGLGDDRAASMERAESFERLHNLGSSCDWWVEP